MKTAKLLGISSVIAVMLLLASCSAKEKVIKVLLDKTANELNKTCPMMVDSETRLDNASVLPGNIFQYNYTIVNYVKDSLDAGALQASIQPNMLNQIKTNPDLKLFRDNDVTLAYNYVDKNGVFILKLSFGPEDYK